MSVSSLKLTLVVSDQVSEPGEIQGKGVRRVRTAGGVRQYGQPIGTIITRDMVERARRRRSSGGGFPEASGGPKPTPARRQPKLTVSVSRAEPAAPPRKSDVPVTEEARAGDLRPGDRIFLDTGQGNRLATVGEVSEDGRDTVLDVTYDDGTTDSIYADPSEVITRFIGDVPDRTEPDEKPDDSLPETEVSAADIKAGDKIADADGGILTVVAARRDKKTGLNNIVTANAAGRRETNAVSDRTIVARVKEAPAPDPLPAGVPSSRPPLATYQRRNLIALDLEDSKDENIRQAAIRIRARQPITAEQSAALADHIRGLAEAEKPRRQRSLARLANAVGVVDARLNGNEIPVVREADKMDKTTVGEATEGDWIAIRRPNSPDAQVGKVTGMRSLLGGRLREVTLTDADGRESQRLLTPDTTAYLLPDLRDPEPVPDPGPPPVVGEASAERIPASEIRRGDLVRIPDVIRGGEAEVRVTRVLGFVNGRISINGTRVNDQSSFGGQVDPAATVERLESPFQTITHDEVQVGDTIAVPGMVEGYEERGSVEEIRSVTGENEDGSPINGTEYSLRHPTGGYLTTVTAYDGDRITLENRDPDALNRIKREREDREISLKARLVADALSIFKNQTRRNAADRLTWVVGRDFADNDPASPMGNPEHLRSEIEATRSEFVEKDRRRQARATARRLLPDGADEAQVKLLADNLDGIFADVERRGIDEIVKSVAEATPIPGRTLAAARHETARRLADPMLQSYEEDRTITSAAQTLARAATALQAGAAEEEDGPSLPETVPGEDLAAAVGRIRSALGNPADFGKRRMRKQTFAPTTLAELADGKVPEIRTEVVPVEDVAEDNGPGQRAMEHLSLVKQAGAAIRQDVSRRVAEALDGSDPDAERRAAAEAVERTKAARVEFRAGSERRLVIRRDEETRNLLGVSYDDAVAQLRRLNVEYNRAALAPDRNSAEGMERKKVAQEARDSFERRFNQARANAYRRSDDADELDRLFEEWQQALRNQVEVNARVGRVVSEARRDALAEVRDMGGHRLKYDKTDRAKAAKAMRWAERFYPTDWLRAADGTAIKLKDVTRGYYRHQDSLIALSGNDAEYSRNWYNGTAIHELGHRMEREVAGLLAAEKAFLWSRTSEGEIGSRRRTPVTSIYGGTKEVGYRDDFTEHYTGKIYNHDAYEVFTTGIESVFAGSPYMDGDQDFEDFMLGVLATL